ncbi:MAG: L-seryl-tRNA(Sec) selenium transferase [Gemmatimonadales bacterium]
MNDGRHHLPAVNKLIAQAEEAGITELAPRAVVVQAIRQVIQEARDAEGLEPEGGWLGAVREVVDRKMQLSLRPVINATGVVLHTNLGRAPLAEAAWQAVQAALGYGTLEYDLQEGARGSRQSHVKQLLCELTGAESALVATNAAAALLLLLNTVASDGETIVSRGELVEIGGSFRLPEVLAKAGTLLVEVGTTNRTRLKDYALAVSPRTRLILKVHRSNFSLRGFVTEASLEDLVRLGEERRIPVAYDLGSGLLISLAEFGLEGEPLVTDAVRAGGTTVFSGDKLMGGPQAGIILGRATIVGRAAENPLSRALRPDKLTLAALEATLMLYRDRDEALAKVPVLRMLTADHRTLAETAARLAGAVSGAEMSRGTSVVGGGSFPDARLPTTLVSIPAADCDGLAAALRRNSPPVIARVEEGRVVLDPRTIGENEIDVVADALRRVLGTQR